MMLLWDNKNMNADNGVMFLFYFRKLIWFVRNILTVELRKINAKVFKIEHQ